MQGKAIENVVKTEEKFLFHLNVFDAAGNLPEENTSEIDPPPVVYSEAELESAKAKAFADGRLQAEQDAAASRARHLAAVMDAIVKETSALFAQEHLREKIYEREAVDLTLKIFEKLFPAYSRAHGFEELKAFITAVLDQHGGKKRINIFVEPDLVGGVEKFMEPLSVRYEGLRFVVTADHDLPAGGCKIRWEDGGAIRDNQGIAEEIHRILQDALAGGGAKGHDEDMPSQDVVTGGAKIGP